MKKIIATLALAAGIAVSAPAVASASWLDTGSVGTPGTTPCLTYPDTSVIGWACTEEDKDAIRDARRVRAAERRAEREAAKAEAWATLEAAQH
jgi:hypothetical protein